MKMINNKSKILVHKLNKNLQIMSLYKDILGNFIFCKQKIN